MTFLGKSDPLPPFGAGDYVWLEGVIPMEMQTTYSRRVPQVSYRVDAMIADDVLDHYIPTL